jgi:uridine kinase
VSAKAPRAISIVGIAGGSASGKSTLANLLRDYLGSDHCSIINSDDYYMAQDDIPLDLRARHNYDHPSALEFDLLAQHIRSLKAGQGVDSPIYDFALYTRKHAQVRRIEPKPIVLVDGALILAIPAIRDLFDFKVFVEAPDPIRYQRRVARDLQERGRNESECKRQWNDTVKPMFEEFCEPSMAYADLVVDGLALSKDTLALIWGTIRSRLQEH